MFEIVCKSLIFNTQMWPRVWIHKFENQGHTDLTRQFCITNPPYLHKNLKTLKNTLGSLNLLQNKNVIWTCADGEPTFSSVGNRSQELPQAWQWQQSGSTLALVPMAKKHSRLGSS